MENKPTVSIVVPIYNVDKYLRRCVESLLAQDYPSFEIILVDDGSPDASGKICDEYAAKLNNIRVIHKENGGLSSARKAGFDVANGDLICFVDSDDYVSPQYVSKLAEPFLHDNIQLAMCGYVTQTDKSTIPSLLPYTQTTIVNGDIPSSYILPLIGTIWNMDAINIPGFVTIRMYRKNLLDAKDFVSEREYFTEDIIMNLLYASRITGNMAVVNEPLYYYCVNPGSLTLKYRDGVFLMLMARYNFCKVIAIENNILDSEQLRLRLYGNLTAVVTRSVYNIGRKRNYQNFKCELNKIFNQPDIKDLFESGNWPKKATWHRIIYYAYKLNLYFVLYKLLKTRKVL